MTDSMRSVIRATPVFVKRPPNPARNLPLIYNSQTYQRRRHWLLVRVMPACLSHDTERACPLACTRTTFQAVFLVIHVEHIEFLPSPWIVFINSLISLVRAQIRRSTSEEAAKYGL